MQLRSALALVLGAVAGFLPALPGQPAVAAHTSAVRVPPAPVASRELPPAAARPALRGRRPTCGNPASTTFPLRSHLSGGPASYTAGGPRHTFSLTLTNTTSAQCREVHPLVVVVDRIRLLTPRQLRLEYAPPASGSWRAVHFETSDDNENIGLPGGEGGPGFTIPARGSLTVRLRLGFTADARPDRVVVSATTMQRRGKDGAWIGDSNHYTFDILDGRPQLAATGGRKDALLALGGIGGVLMLGGTALVLAARRRGRQPR